MEVIERISLAAIPVDAREATAMVLRAHPELHQLDKPVAYTGCSPSYALVLRMAWATGTVAGTTYYEALTREENEAARRRHEVERGRLVQRHLEVLEADIGHASGRWRLDSFDVDGGNPETSGHLFRARQLCAYWATRVVEGGWRDNTPRVTLLLGSRQTGCGKTHLAVGVARDIVERTGCSARFARLADYLRAARDADRWSSAGDQRSVAGAVDLDDYRRCGVLVLDEMSLAGTPGYLLDRVVDLVDERIRWERPTVITGQFGSDDELALPRGDDAQALDAARRLRSRLSTGVSCIMHPTLRDRRTAA